MSSQKGFAQIFILLILVAGLAIGAYLVKNPQVLKSRANIDAPTAPQTAFGLLNSDQPAGLGDEFTVPVTVRSDIDSTNLFAAKISFPKDKIEVVRFDKSDSFVSNWVEEFYDNTTGEVSIVGGLPTPGLLTQTSEKSKVMVNIVFKSKTQSGEAQLSFTPDAAIYRDSDNTNILGPKYDLALSWGQQPSPSTAPVASFVKVTYPNDGQPFRMGDVMWIAWDYSSDLLSCDISWVDEAGNNQIIGYTPASPKKFDWIVQGNSIQPAAGTTKKVKIQIGCRPAGVNSPVITDLSDNYSVISPAPTPTPVSVEYLALDAGWNFIGVPVYVNSTGGTTVSANDLLNMSGCVQAAEWMGDVWRTYNKGSSSQVSFPLQSGKGYFVKCEATGRKSFSLSGLPNNSLPSLSHGWNAVALPYNNTYSTVKDLINAFDANYIRPNIKEVDRWDAGGWDPHIASLLANNFSVSKDKGYFVKYQQPNNQLAIKSLSLPSSTVSETPLQVNPDVNGDGKTNLVDISYLLSKFNKTSNIGGADINQDGVVNSFDYSHLVKALIDNKVIKVRI